MQPVLTQPERGMMGLLCTECYDTRWVERPGVCSTCTQRTEAYIQSESNTVCAEDLWGYAIFKQAKNGTKVHH